MHYHEILCESTPRTLYHGTLRQYVPMIMQIGLMPTVSGFTERAYGAYIRKGIELPAMVFAADRTGLGKCVSAIVGAMEQAGIADREEGHTESFFRHGAIIVLKHAAESFKHRPDEPPSLDPHPPSKDHPVSVETNDYYREEGIKPSFAIMGDRLRSFLRRHGQMLDNHQWFDRKAMITQLITLVSKRNPGQDMDSIVDRIRRKSDSQLIAYWRRLTWK
jgi:hypothetical protein